MDNIEINKDNEGFLLDPTDWNKQIAILISKDESIELTEDHWLIVEYIREYFELNQSVPELRKLLSHLKSLGDKDKATRKFIYSLFPYGYGQQACKIAGMRKPLKLMLDV